MNRRQPDPHRRSTRGPSPGAEPTARRAPPATAPTRRVGWTIVAIFALGLGCRIAAFGDYLENDELLYRALVQQLDAGRGYTLQGHPILAEPWVAKEQYDLPLFYHPPGGPLLFWAAQRLVGEAGSRAVQVASWATFYWAMVGLWSLLARRREPAVTILVAGLAAFTPIVTHVVSRSWLEGPQLAALTAATAVLLLAAHRRRLALAGLAGALLGVAGLVKLTAVLAVPGILLLLVASARERALPRRFGLAAAGVFLASALLVHLPWELWHWHVTGSPFPNWSGKPVAGLVATNPYVQFVTVVRTPWSYASLLPRALWTLAPALLLVVLQWRDDGLRARCLAASAWIAVVVGVNMVLGATGYSKLLRYVVLVTPATILLFGFVTAATLDARRERRWLPGGPWATDLALLAAAVGWLLEIVQGLDTPFRGADLILPLWGGDR